VSWVSHSAKAQQMETKINRDGYHSNIEGGFGCQIGFLHLLSDQAMCLYFLKKSAKYGHFSM
jgi:hypothetical protein